MVGEQRGGRTPLCDFFEDSPRVALALLLLLVLAARAGCSDEDEFARPTHTPTVQLLRPRPGDVAAVGDGGLLVAFASPAGVERAVPCPALRPRQPRARRLTRMLGAVGRVLAEQGRGCVCWWTAALSR